MGWPTPLQARGPDRRARAGSSSSTGTPPQRFLLTEPAIEVDTWEPDVFTICEDELLSAVVRCQRRYGLARPGGWRTRLESVSEMRADAATFRVWTSRRAFENEECLFSRTWTFGIPRDGG